MGEFDDALGRILGDPSAMARIAKLAQSLGGSDSPPPPPVPDAPPGSAPMQDASGVSQGTAPPPSRPESPPELDAPTPDPPPIPGLSDLAGLADSPMVRKLLPLLLEGRRNSEARRFLYALRPYLSQRRQENVERALQLARLIRVGRRFLWEGQGGGSP